MILKCLLTLALAAGLTMDVGPADYCVYLALATLIFSFIEPESELLEVLVTVQGVIYCISFALTFVATATIQRQLGLAILMLILSMVSKR